jgi:predicted aldo/keto reductase-like oxidoreductase
MVRKFGGDTSGGKMIKRGLGRLTRREFMSNALIGAGTVGFSDFGAPKRYTHRLPSSIPGKKAGNPIIHRMLGMTSIRLPIVNMGVMGAGNPDLVKRSYEQGVRHFDTASFYQRGQNESMVGKAIQELGVRNQVIIGTKAYVPHEQRSRMCPTDLKKFFLDTAEESLRRLQTDVIDIFYVHNVQDLGYMNNPGIIEALRILKKSGKARHIGYSAHTNMTELVQEACRSGLYEVLAVAFNYSMADDHDLKAALEKAQARGIGLIAMKTQCMQYWCQENVPGEKQSYYEGKILQTAVLKWVLRHEFITCAIPGYTNFEQMEEDLSVASGLEYTPEERRFLEDRAVKVALMSYCRQCRRCLSTCPRGVDIPALMRTHLYAVCYANYDQARQTIRGISNGRDLRACASCEDCSARCRRRVPVGQRIQELKIIYG